MLPSTNTTVQNNIFNALLILFQLKFFYKCTFYILHCTVQFYTQQGEVIFLQVGSQNRFNQLMPAWRRRRQSRKPLPRMRCALEVREDHYVKTTINHLHSPLLFNVFTREYVVFHLWAVTAFCLFSSETNKKIEEFTVR